jgi:hypothetical protein
MSESNRVWKHNSMEEPENECITLTEYIEVLLKLVEECQDCIKVGQPMLIIPLLDSAHELLDEMSKGEWRVNSSEAGMEENDEE